MAVKVPVATESQTQKAIFEYLAIVRRFFCWRSNTGAFSNLQGGFYRFGKKGSGDILGLTHEGQFFSIEVKKRGYKPSPEQIEFMRLVNASNGIAFVAYSVEDVERNLP